jgi:hypothetical protein
MDAFEPDGRRKNIFIFTLNSLAQPYIGLNSLKPAAAARRRINPSSIKTVNFPV